MRFLDEFRDPDLALRLVAEIRRTATRRWTLMEVCGGQTHSLLRHGIDAELADRVELIHGPGCPVCVTRPEAIDQAIRLSRLPEVILTSFGDMLRVPGHGGSLLEARAAGGNVRAVYSPLDAVRIAREQPDRQVVFFAVGFETTAPATALAVCQAARLGLDNFSLLVEHVRVLPAMEQLAAAPDCRVDGFLAAGHVCTVTGFEAYGRFAETFGMPVAITGFEPVDLLLGIAHCVRELEAGRSRVINGYERVARVAGNPAAIDLVEQVYRIVDREWRGLGRIPDGGFGLREEYQRFAAELRFADRLSTLASTIGKPALPLVAPSRCRAGDVLVGRIKPTQCEAFGSGCTPETPLGAPMVSDEGACAAYHRYVASGREPAVESPA